MLAKSNLTCLQEEAVLSTAISPSYPHFDPCDDARRLAAALIGPPSSPPGPEIILQDPLHRSGAPRVSRRSAADPNRYSLSADAEIYLLIDRSRRCQVPGHGATPRFCGRLASCHPSCCSLRAVVGTHRQCWCTADHNKPTA